MGDPPLFDPTLEVAADRIQELATDGLSRNHISVTPVMCWQPTAVNPLSKYSFLTDDHFQLEIHFGNVAQLDLGQRVLICLKGVVIESRPTLKLPKLPFKLVFSDGVVLQSGGQIRDTFPDEPPPSPKVPSWFKSQTVRASSPIPSSPTHASSPQRASSPPSRIQPGPSPKSELTHTPPSSPSSIKQPRAATPTHHSDLPPPQDWAELTSSGKRPRHNTEDACMSDIRPGPLARRKSVAELTEGYSEALSTNNSIAHRSKKKRRRNKKSLAPERNPALDMTAGCWSPPGV
ncbi:hypothetical protein OPQ81_007193 [Rhizoctonia solani]|nr:hypothetical protein OPQ81_007193 [Rhizoctonia solani]